MTHHNLERPRLTIESSKFGERHDQTKEELVHMLGTPALQEWIRALVGFNVLGSPVILSGLSAHEQQPL